MEDRHWMVRSIISWPDVKLNSGCEVGVLSGNLGFRIWGVWKPPVSATAI